MARGVRTSRSSRTPPTPPTWSGPNGYYPPRPGESQAPAVGRREAERAVPFDEMDGRRPALDGVRVRGRCRGGSGRRRSGATRRRRRFRRSGSFWTMCASTLRSGRKSRATCRRRPPRRIARRVPRPRLRRRDHRESRVREMPLRPVAVLLGKGCEQRLGRLPVLLGAHDARGPGRRAGGPGRDAGDRGQAEPSRGQPAQERAADARRLHGLSLQPHEPPRVEPPPRHPQRVPDDGAARCELSLVARPRSPRNLPWLFSEAGAREVAAPDPPWR